MEKTMKVLVTGGAGFIGSHCVDQLLQNGNEVSVIDIKPKSEADNLAHCFEDITYYEGDIRVPGDVATAIEGCTHVLHLAAIVSVPVSIDDPKTTHDTNVTGALNVLEAARQAGVKRFVYASSAAVYGDDAILPVTETNPTLPQSPYGLHKLINEQYAELYERIYDMQPAGLRFFNVYGTRQDPTSPYSGVISKFIQAANNKELITVYGDGSATRDFIHVTDVSKVCCTALSGNQTGVFNIGTGTKTNIKTIAETISALATPAVGINYVDKRAGDVLHSQAEVSNMINAFMVKPEAVLEEALNELFTSFLN